MGKKISAYDRDRKEQLRPVRRKHQHVALNTSSDKAETDTNCLPARTVLNCWEFLHCGRQPGGKNISEFGICPAASEEKYHQINGGMNGGRFCWLVENTLCNGSLESDFLEKFERCLQCNFYRIVHQQE